MPRHDAPEKTADSNRRPPPIACTNLVSCGHPHVLLCPLPTESALLADRPWSTQHLLPPEAPRVSATGADALVAGRRLGNAAPPLAAIGDAQASWSGVATSPALVERHVAVLGDVATAAIPCQAYVLVLRRRCMRHRLLRRFWQRWRPWRRCTMGSITILRAVGRTA